MWRDAELVFLHRIGQLRFLSGNVVSVTLVTFQRRGLVEDHRIAVDQSSQRMALSARNVGMAAGQGEWSPLVVIKRRRSPTLRGVAVGARGLAGAVSELSAVRLLVAGFAFLRRPFELDFLLAGKGLVALATGHGAVSTEQGKLCLGVVKSVHVRPGTRIMTGFAAERRAVRPAPGHAIAELPVVRVLMAGGAGLIDKPERQNLVGAVGKPLFVTFVAWNGRVSTRQRKFCLLVHRDGEKRAVKTLHGMAVFAAVVVRRGSELPVMGIFVAIGTIREFDLIDRVFSRGDVALRAFNGGVLPFQRVSRGPMLFHTE